MRRELPRIMPWLAILPFIALSSEAGISPLIEIQKLAASDGMVGDEFGGEVELLGDDAIIGERRDDEGGSAAVAAYVFGRQANGSWVETQKLLPSSTLPPGSWSRAADHDASIATMLHRVTVKAVLDRQLPLTAPDQS